MLVVGLVSAGKTFSTVIVKVVSDNFGLSSRVLAGCGVPVTGFVACPSFLIEGVRADHVFANITDTVTVGIVVSGNVSVAYVTSAGYLVPMIGSIAVPDIHIICMLANYVGAYVADTVLVSVGVNAINVGTALITLKVYGICIYVIYTFKILIASVTLKVIVDILVNRAGENEVTIVTNVVFGVLVYMLTVNADTALVTLGVAVHIHVLSAGDSHTAEVTLGVTILVCVVGALKLLSANVTDKILVSCVYVIGAGYGRSAKITYGDFIRKIAVNVRSTRKRRVAVIALEVSVRIHVLGTCTKSAGEER